jgi:hypothetical protein
MILDSFPKEDKYLFFIINILYQFPPPRARGEELVLYTFTHHSSKDKNRVLLFF